MNIQEQIAFEKFQAKDSNCDYEELKQRLDHLEKLSGHRYLPMSPRHEAWLVWGAAWKAKAQAVPEGFVLVPKVPTEEILPFNSLYEILDCQECCDAGGFCQERYIQIIEGISKAMKEAQEQKG